MKALDAGPRSSERTLAARQLLDWLKNRGHSLKVVEITPADVKGFIGWVLDHRSDAPAKQGYSSLAVLFSWHHTEGEIETNPMERVTKPKVTVKPVEVLGHSQLDMLRSSSVPLTDWARKTTTMSPGRSWLRWPMFPIRLALSIVAELMPVAVHVSHGSTASWTGSCLPMDI